MGNFLSIDSLIILGDLNLVVSMQKKWGDHYKLDSDADFFRHILHNTI